MEYQLPQLSKRNIRLSFIGIKIYIVLGGCLFSFIEEPHRLKTCTQNGNILQDFLIANENSTDYRVEAVRNLLNTSHDNPMSDNMSASKINISIFNYQGSCQNSLEKWSLCNSMFYCLTIITTIGYGNKAPRTKLGKIITIPYALLGFSIVFVFVSMCTVKMKRNLDLFARRIDGIFGFGKLEVIEDPVTESQELQGEGSSKTPETSPAPSHKARSIFFLLYFTIHFLIPAIIFSKMENWDFFTSLYFVFITLSTIGFGDYTPDFEKSGNYSRKYFYQVMTCTWILVSIFGTAYWIGVVNEWASGRAKKRIERIKDKIQEKKLGR